MALDRRRSSTDLKTKTQQQDVQKGYKMFMGAKVLWPPECDDEILEKTILEVQSMIKTQDLQRDGQKIAQDLKKWMDEQFEPHWHVYFGKNFGSLVTYETRKFVYFYIDKVAFLLYKMG